MPHTAYRQRPRRRRRPMAEMNVIPYIDVMLVLLIIFMISAPPPGQGVYVKTPQDTPGMSPLTVRGDDPSMAIIHVSDEGDIFINHGDEQNKPVSMTTLANRAKALRAYNPDIPVYVKGEGEEEGKPDTGTSYGQVWQALSGLQAAGVEDITLVMPPESQE